MKAIFLLLTLPFLFQTQRTCQGKLNQNAIVTQSPIITANVTNAIEMKIPNDPNNITIVHIYGTPYQYGYAQGLIRKESINLLIGQVFTHYIAQVDQMIAKYISFIPTSIRQFLIKHLLLTLLDIQWLLNEAYIPDYWIQQMKGIADGSGFSEAMIRRINTIPQLIQMQCSMMGAWGEATKNAVTQQGISLDGSLLQLRALDWQTKGPFQKYLQLTIYHPDQGYGHAFASFGFPGYISALTGFSQAGVGVSQKVWIHNPLYNATRSRIGYPTGLMLRDVLQFDNNKQDAINRVFSIRRTNSIFFGVGDAETMEFTDMMYSHNKIFLYNDKNFTAWDTHKRRDGILYWTKGTQPQDSTCMDGQIEKYYGKITPKVIMESIVALEGTGDLHVAIYDYKNFNIYLAGATPVQPDGSFTPAYDRGYVRIDMNEMFKVKRP